jgi:cysteine synthase B
MASYDILDAIGSTPLVELRRMSPKPGVRIFGKLEGCNPTGSVKDRVALYLVRRAEADGSLTPGCTLVEASTGNTALSLALLAKQLGYGLKVVMPLRVTPGMVELLELLGTEIIPGEFEVGMKGAIDQAVRLGREKDHHAVRQFQDEANVLAHYETTGPEILQALPQVDVFVAGIGTGGTVMGVGKRLRERDPALRVIGVTPSPGDEIQGLRSLDQGYLPPLLDESLLDGRFMVDAAASFAMMKELLAREGLFAGLSSGAALHAALRVAERMESGNIVVLLADTGWRYMPALFGMGRLMGLGGDPDNRAWW